MDGFKDGYADIRKVKNAGLSSRDDFVTTKTGELRTVESIMRDRQVLADGVRHTLLSQMKEENERSQSEARKMQEEHNKEYNSMLTILQMLKKTNLDLKKAQIDRLKAYKEAGENDSENEQAIMMEMAALQNDLTEQKNTLQQKSTATQREVSSTDAAIADQNAQTDLKKNQMKRIRLMADLNITMGEQRELDEGMQQYEEHVDLLAGVLREDNTSRRPALSWWRKRSRKQGAEENVAGLERSKEQLQDSLTRKAKNWNEKRKRYHEGSYRLAYERYDMAARRYRIMAKNTDTSSEYRQEEHGKDIREYRAEFDLNNVQKLIETSANNPYMALDKLVVRDWNTGAGFYYPGEEQTVKSHRRIAMVSEEKGENGQFLRYKMTFQDPEHGSAGRPGENPQDEKVYLSRRQFKSVETGTALDDHLGEKGDLVKAEDVKLYDDAKDLNDELIYSKDTVEYFDVHKKGNRKQTARGIFLLGEFVSANEAIVKDRSEVADEGEGHFTLKQRDDLEKTVYAMKKSVFFSHVNARSLQYYMGYRAEEEYAVGIKDMIKKGFENPFTGHQLSVDQNNYYRELSGIFEESYLSQVASDPDNLHEELPNEKEASLEKYILTGTTTDAIEESLNQKDKEETGYIMVRVLADRLRYDTKRGQTVFDHKGQRYIHRENRQTASDKLLKQIKDMDRGQILLRLTAKYLLASENPDDWKLAKGICLDRDLLNMGENPAFKKRLELAKAEDGMIWRMEALDELDRKRSLNEKSFGAAKQVIEEDKASQRGEKARNRQLAKTTVKATTDLLTSSINVLGLEINNNWLKLSKTFLSNLSGLYPDDYTKMITSASKELGGGALAASLLSHTTKDNAKKQFDLFKDDNTAMTTVIGMVQTTYSLYHFCVKNPDFSKVRAKAMTPVIKGIIDLWASILELFNVFAKFDPTGVVDSVQSIIGNGLDIFKNSLEIKESHQVQKNVDSLLSTKKKIEKEVDAPDSTATERKKEVVSRFRESSQYEYALPMARKAADRKVTAGAVTVAKDAVNIGAEIAGLAGGKVIKTLSKTAAKAIGTVCDVSMMNYSMVKDEKEIREDILKKGLKNDKLRIDSERISKMDKSVLNHAVRRTTGINGFDYLLDASRLMVAIDVHSAFQKAIISTPPQQAQGDGQGQQALQQSDTALQAHKAVALSIAAAIMPQRYSTTSQPEELGKVSVDHLLSALGFAGNRIMFTRNAIGYDGRVRSMSEMRNG